MQLTTIADWIAWAGIVLPLSITAFSAMRYVGLEAEKRRASRYSEFYRLMDQIGMSGGSIASKMAAISELKKYPEYKEVILRLCSGASIAGTEAHLLVQEFSLTAQHIGGASRSD